MNWLGCRGEKKGTLIRSVGVRIREEKARAERKTAKRAISIKFRNVPTEGGRARRDP